MEELQVIETTSGRQFKPWASREDVQAIKQETVLAVAQAVQDPASITAIVSEIASGKQAIASAINAKGGSASATESFAELAEAVEEIPNFSDMAKLAGIIAGGNYDKNALQGHNENVKYGKTEIVDHVGAFEKISFSYIFKYWDLLTTVKMPYLTKAGDWGQFEIFGMCTNLKKLIIPSCRIFGHYIVGGCSNLENIEIYSPDSNFSLYPGQKDKLRNVTVYEDDVNTNLSLWSAANVIAEGQSGIDELNDNLYNNLLTKLYDHSGDGQTRTLRIGWLANVTAENIAYANAKGWTLTT